jgi:hypothetical protein
MHQGNKSNRFKRERKHMGDKFKKKGEVCHNYCPIFQTPSKEFKHKGKEN